MRRFVARFNFSFTLIGNRPQSLTGHIVNRYVQHQYGDTLTLGSAGLFEPEATPIAG